MKKLFLKSLGAVVLMLVYYWVIYKLSFIHNMQLDKTDAVALLVIWMYVMHLVFGDKDEE